MVPCHNELYMQIYAEVIDREESDTNNKILPRYIKHVDQRYLFKLFGEQYWISISELDFLSGTEGCEQIKIPNRDEFKLENGR